MSRAGIRLTRGEKIFEVINILFMCFLALIMVYPFWHVLMYSLTPPQYSGGGGMFFWPKGGFSLSSYNSVFKNPLLWTGLRTTVTVTVVTGAAGVFFTATTAYPLSKKRMHGRNFFMFIVFFTMLFGGGLVPGYLLVRDLGLLDSLWALILPGLLGAWNIIIMRNFFANIHESLEESARIDGASDLRIFFSIILPLSKAVLATIFLFIAVGKWNDYFSTILYIQDREKWMLQAVLREMINNTAAAMSRSGVSITDDMMLTPESIKTTTIIVATVPILIVYPFLQKYFVKGVMIGSVKG